VRAVALSHAARLRCVTAQGRGSGAVAWGIGNGRRRARRRSVGRGRCGNGRHRGRWPLHPEISSSPHEQADPPSRMSFVRQLSRMPVATSMIPFGLPDRAAALFSARYWIGFIAHRFKYRVAGGLIYTYGPCHRCNKSVLAYWYNTYNRTYKLSVS
jgi:hypothetical protein